MAIGLTALEITDVDAANKRVAFRAQSLDPPADSDADSWHVESPNRLSAGGDSVTIDATIKPASSFTSPQSRPRVSTTSPWTGILSFSEVFFGDVASNEELVLRLTVEGVSDTVTGTFDLAQIDEDFDTPEVEQNDSSDSAGSGTSVEVNNLSTDTLGVSDTTQLPERVYEDQSGLVPVLRERDRDGNVVRTFEPLVVTRLGGTLPWDTESTQLQCGSTVTDTDGDMNTRLVYHAVCTKEQFKRLVAMRSSPQRIKLVSHGYSGPVTFDQLKWDRVPDANGVVTPSGETSQPIYEIQLQSKETQDN